MPPGRRVLQAYPSSVPQLSPSSTGTFSGCSASPDACACSTISFAKSSSSMPWPIRVWIRSRVIEASGIEAEVHVLAQQLRGEGDLEVEVDEGRRLVAREGRAHHALVHEVEERVA